MAGTGTEGGSRESMLHAQDYLKILRNRYKLILTVFIVIFATSIVVTRTMTPQYISTASFEIKPPGDLIRFTAEGDNNPIQVAEGGVAWRETQYDVLVSEKNLRVVAQNLKLPEEWGVDELTAVNMLRGMISVKPRIDTNIIDVIVQHSDPRVAQQICASVPESYREMREEKENQQIGIAISERENMLKKLSKTLQDKKDAVRAYIREGKYISLNINQGGSATPASAGAEEKTYDQLHTNMLALESEIAQMQVHIEKLHDLRDADLLSYVTRTGLLTAESYCSAKVRSLNDKYNEEKDTRDQLLLSGYGERHPKVLMLDQQHESTQKDLFAELVGMRDAMIDQLDVKKKELDDVNLRLKNAEGALRAKTEEDQKVQQALQEYTQEKARYDRLESDLIADKMRMSAPRLSIEIYNNATLPVVPSKPNYKLNLAVGAVAGLVAGILAALIFQYFDTSVKTLEDAEQHLGLPVLGVIPRDVGLLMLQQGNSPDAEAYRILRTNIELKRTLLNASVFVVTSSNAGEGKSTTVSNLAYVCATSGYSTLMIDGDMRRPRLARYAEMQSSRGLSDYLSHDDVELKDVVFRSEVPNLYLLPAGATPADPSGLISSSYRMDRLLEEARRRFDIVLVDSPPVLGVSDASLLVSKGDATLMVLQPRRMPLKALLRAKSVIEGAGGRLIGLVMNNVDISGDTQYQYYTTYYSYYQDDTKGKGNSSTASGAGRAVARKQVASNGKATENAAGSQHSAHHSDEELY